MRHRSKPQSALLVACVILGSFLGGLALAAGSPRPAAAQTVPPEAPFAAKGLEVIGHNDLGQNPGATSDVWLLGRTAYVGYWCGPSVGSSVVDVSDPTRPRVLFQTQVMPGAFADDIFALHLDTPKFKGDVLIEPHDRCQRVAARTRIWDIRAPATPKLLSSLLTCDGVHNSYAFQRGQNAYLILAAPNADRAGNAELGCEESDLDADFVIVDITDPAQPTIVGRWNLHDEFGDNLPGDIFQHDVWVNAAGTVAYGSYWDYGMVMLDISDVTHPRYINRFAYPATEDGNTHVTVLSKDEHYAILADEDRTIVASYFSVLSPAALSGDKRSTNQGAIVNTPVTANLVWVGRGCDADPNYGLSQPDPYLHDATGKIAVVYRGGCSRAGKVRQAQANGAVGLVMANNVPDNSPPSGGGAPNGVTIPGAGISYQDGNAITTTLEAGTPVMGRLGSIGDDYGFTRIVDIRDPMNPRQVAEYTVPETRAFPPVPERSTFGFGWSAHNLWVDGDTLFVSHYDAGVRMVDIKDPTKPKELGYLIPGDRLTDSGPAGSTTWGVMVDDRDLIYATDMANGLWVLRATGAVPTPPTAPTRAPATPTPSLGDHVCPQIAGRVPPSVLADALANPPKVSGYHLPLDAGKPVDRLNPLRTWLSLHTFGKPYHPLDNALEYKVGCP